MIILRKVGQYRGTLFLAGPVYKFKIYSFDRVGLPHLELHTSSADWEGPKIWLVRFRPFLVGCFMIKQAFQKMARFRKTYLVWKENFNLKFVISYSQLSQ